MTLKYRRVRGIILAAWLGALLLTACGEGSPTAGSLANTPAATAKSGNTPGSTVLPPTPVMTLAPHPTGQTPADTPYPTATDARPPAQPTTGPGSSEKIFASVVSHNYGQGDQGYYIFEPATPRPDKPLPLVVLLHGYVGLNIPEYRPWIDHIVQRGNVVIFPLYQTYDSRDGELYTSNATTAIKAAIEQLKDGSHVAVDLERFFITGYSAGGVIATNLTARAVELGLPVPRALLAVTPGGCSNCSVLAIRNFKLAEPAELALIPATTKMVVLVGDRDTVVGKVTANIIWQNTAQIPAANKNYLEVSTDAHGVPALVADHGMATHRPANAFNYFAIWKLFDGLESCSLTNHDCEYALGGTPQQLNLGRWSDDKPVIPLKVLG